MQFFTRRGYHCENSLRGKLTIVDYVVSFGCFLGTNSGNYRCSARCACGRVRFSSDCLPFEFCIANVTKFRRASGGEMRSLRDTRRPRHRFQDVERRLGLFRIPGRFFARIRVECHETRVSCSFSRRYKCVRLAEEERRGDRRAYVYRYDWSSRKGEKHARSVEGRVVEGREAKEKTGERNGEKDSSKGPSGGLCIEL